MATASTMTGSRPENRGVLYLVDGARPEGTGPRLHRTRRGCRARSPRGAAPVPVGRRGDGRGRSRPLVAGNARAGEEALSATRRTARHANPGRLDEETGGRTRT